MSSEPRPITVLSPHLDDAVLSLGAWIFRSVAAGRSVRIVTVFAGANTTDAEPSDWERRSGFRSPSEAVETRRREDLAACRLLGAQPVWLPYDDCDHAEPRDDALIWRSIETAIRGSSIVLIPGFPLVHPDHEYVTRLVLGYANDEMRVGLYAEQPYQFWEFASGGSLSRRLATWGKYVLRRDRILREQAPVTREDLGRRISTARWTTHPRNAADVVHKVRAIRKYRSQLKAYGGLFMPQLLVYEWGRGGESIAGLDAPSHRDPSSSF